MGVPVGLPLPGAPKIFCTRRRLSTLSDAPRSDIRNEASRNSQRSCHGNRRNVASLDVHGRRGTAVALDTADLQQIATGEALNQSLEIVRQSVGLDAELRKQRLVR